MRAWKFTAGENASSPTRGCRSKPSLHTRSGVVWSKYSNAGDPERVVLVVGARADVSADVASRTPPGRGCAAPAAMREPEVVASTDSVSRHRDRSCTAAGTGKSNRLRRVLPGELAHVVGGEAADLRVQDLLGVGPGAVLVRVVGLEQHVVDADAVALLEPGRVVDGAEPEVALQHLAR